MARSPILTRRRTLTALATLAGGPGLLTACTSARPRPAATITAAPASAPAASQAPVPSTASPSPAASALPVNVYANIAPGLVNPAWAHDPVRVYVPNSLSNTVSEIDPRSHRVIRTFPVGAEP